MDGYRTCETLESIVRLEFHGLKCLVKMYFRIVFDELFRSFPSLASRASWPARRDYSDGSVATECEGLRALRRVAVP